MKDYDEKNLKNPLIFVGIINTEIDNGYDDECMVCHKEIKESKFSVHACNGSYNFICSNADHDIVTEDAGNMGYWGVGPECVKKIKAHLKEEGVNPDDYIHITKEATQ